MNSKGRSLSFETPWSRSSCILSRSLLYLVTISGRTAFLSIVERAAKTVDERGTLGASSRGAPRTTAGEIGQPQSLSRGGPSEAGPRGISPSISFKLGNAGLVASGWTVKRSDKLIGTVVIQSLDLLAEMGMIRALTEKPLIPASI